VRNGPLVVALQWIALNRGRLADIARGHDLALTSAMSRRAKP
jgi:hypothetical protein